MHLQQPPKTVQPNGTVFVQECAHTAGEEELSASSALSGDPSHTLQPPHSINVADRKELEVEGSGEDKEMGGSVNNHAVGDATSETQVR